MNLLSVIHYPTFGGPSNEALRLREARARRGWNTLVLLPREPGSAAERLRAGGVEVVQIPLHRLRGRPDPRLHAGFALGFVPEVQRIRRLIRERQIDLVLIGGLVNPHAGIAARLEGIPVVWQIVDTRGPALLRTLTMPFVRRLSDAVLFDGHALIDFHTGSRPLRVPSFVYYPPVDTARFRPSAEARQRTRTEFGIPEAARVVGMVANLSPQKGIEYFVRAAAAIYRAEPQSWFLVVGAFYATHQDYQQRIEVEVRQSGVPRERLIFAGARADVENCYPAMDVKLITSVPASEGTTTTAMEAMACGVPVVATDVGAVREVIAEGTTGFVAPPRDPRSIAEAALRVLRDLPLRERMAHEARRQAVARFDVEVSADTHLRAFEAALANRHADRAESLGHPAKRGGW